MRGAALPLAIVFDLDDTLLAYSAAVEPAWRQVCELFADRVPAASAATLCREIQTQADWYWRDPERHRRGRLDLVAARQEICHRALRHFGCADADLALAMSRKRLEVHEAAIAPFPGALATLDRLRAAGVRLALITNGAAAVQEAKLDRFGLRPFFASVVCEGAFGCGKPEPRVFQHTLGVLDVQPQEAWMVGDNLLMDVAPAQALGLTGIWNDFAGRGLPKDSAVRPERIVRSVAELG